MEKCKNLVSICETFKNRFLQNDSTEFLDMHSNSPWVCAIKVCSNSGTTIIIAEIIAKYDLNIASIMQTFKNLLLQNYSTEFLDIAHKYSLDMCN